VGDLQALMAELDGADAATVHRLAWAHGSLPVRLAMLGLAAVRKGRSPLWWGYPPGVFIGYKWDGAAMRTRVTGLAAHLRQRGYRAFLDVEQLDEAADAYFQIPQFITSLQQCQVYLLLLTRLSAELITAGRHRTSWVHDEFQHAVRLANAGRLVLVPVLLEDGGLDGPFALDQVIDLRNDPRGFAALDDVLPAAPLALDDAATAALAAAVARFDSVFLASRWDDAADVLRASAALSESFDHGLRRLLLAIYTADQAALDAVLPALQARHGAQLVRQLYRGYCAEHGIPDRSGGG